MLPSRVWVTSDIHIDYQENFDRLSDFAQRGHLQDALIVAGDVTDNVDRLEELFTVLVENFHSVLFVPGNHELWVRRTAFQNSIEKYHALRDLCQRCGVSMEPVHFGQARKVWLVPLLSWYDDKDQPEHSLFHAKDYSEDHTDKLWADFIHTCWPEDMNQPIAQMFADENEKHLSRRFNGSVISFSHFLPRQELMFSRGMKATMRLAKHFDPYPEFNFSRVAGSRRIEEQLRRLGSELHVYGHQHRNRVRHIDGVTYVSHCMGYPKERERGHVPTDAVLPLCIWREDTGVCVKQ